MIVERKQHNIATEHWDYVKEAKSIGRHRIALAFDDGTEGVYEMTPDMFFGVYERLEDETFFDRLKAEDGTVVWPDGIHIAPEELYFNCRRAVDETTANRN